MFSRPSIIYNILHLAPTVSRFFSSAMITEIPCQVTLKNEDQQASLASISESGEIHEKVRKQWGQEIIKIFGSKSEEQSNIHPWDLVLHMNGSVESLSHPVLPEDHECCYPAHYRVPPETIQGFTKEEQVERAEDFALGSLLYQIYRGKKPFQELDDAEVQSRFANAIVPEDLTTVPLWPTVLCFWSPEFKKSINWRRRYAKAYLKAHPILATTAAAGASVTVFSGALPVGLSLAGMSATGPVAGSLIGAWQASLGLVQAGSLFSWCQSLMMGGAAVSGLAATGLAGGGIAAGVTSLGLILGSPFDKEAEAKLLEEYREAFLKGVEERSKVLSEKL